MKTVSVPNWWYETEDYYDISHDYRNGYYDEYNNTIDNIPDMEDEDE